MYRVDEHRGRAWWSGASAGAGAINGLGHLLTAIACGQQITACDMAYSWELGGKFFPSEPAKPVSLACFLSLLQQPHRPDGSPGVLLSPRAFLLSLLQQPQRLPPHARAAASFGSLPPSPPLAPPLSSQLCTQPVAYAPAARASRPFEPIEAVFSVVGSVSYGCAPFFREWQASERREG